MSKWQILPITYTGIAYELETRIYQYGYIHRVEVMIDNILVQFEQDDEENYRALVSVEQMEQSKNINIGLLEAISKQLSALNT